MVADLEFGGVHQYFLFNNKHPVAECQVAFSFLRCIGSQLTGYIEVRGCFRDAILENMYLLEIIINCSDFLNLPWPSCNLHPVVPRTHLRFFVSLLVP